MIKREKEILDTNIPIDKHGYRKWIDAKGCYVKFRYGEFSGTIDIIDVAPKRQVLVEYNGKIKWMDGSKLIPNLQIADLLGIITSDFRYDIGYQYKSISGDKIYTVVELIRINGEKQCGILCPECNNIFYHTETDVKEQRGCPYCNGLKVKIGFNDMWTTAPEIARLLKNPEDGYKYTKSSNKKLDWRCPDCGEIIYDCAPTVMSRYDGKFPCKKCGKGTSYPNRFMYNLLLELKEDFLPEKTFPWSNGKVYDFYIPRLNMIIEMHGIQHYIYTGMKMTVEEQQKNDKYKEELARKNGITHYIVIDSRESSAYFIFNNICNSELSHFFQFKYININKIDELSLSKYVFTVVDTLKECGDDIHAAASKLKVSVQTIYKYVYLAEKMGIYAHDAQKAQEKRISGILSTKYQRYGKPYICVETGHVFGDFVALENNAKSIFNRKMTRSCICVALKNNTLSYGYHWQYITHEEFNNIKTRFPDKAFGDFFIA